METRNRAANTKNVTFGMAFRKNVRNLQNRNEQDGQNQTNNEIDFKDIVMLAVTPSENCAPIKIFHEQFDGEEFMATEFVNTCIDNAILNKESIEVGALNVNRHQSIAKNVSIEKRAFQNAISLRKIESRRDCFYNFEKTLVTINANVTKALTIKNPNTAGCLRQFEHLILFLQDDIHPIILKKCPDIVHTIYRICRCSISQDSHTSDWVSNKKWKTMCLEIRSMANNIMDFFKYILKHTVDDNSEFINWFDVQVELFKKLTEKLSEKELFELNEDPLTNLLENV